MMEARQDSGAEKVGDFPHLSALRNVPIPLADALTPLKLSQEELAKISQYSFQKTPRPMVGSSLSPPSEMAFEAVSLARRFETELVVRYRKFLSIVDFKETEEGLVAGYRSWAKAKMETNQVLYLQQLSLHGSIWFRGRVEEIDSVQGPDPQIHFKPGSLEFRVGWPRRWQPAEVDEMPLDAPVLFDTRSEYVIPIGIRDFGCY